MKEEGGGAGGGGGVGGEVGNLCVCQGVRHVVFVSVGGNLYINNKTFTDVTPRFDGFH